MLTPIKGPENRFTPIYSQWKIDTSLGACPQGRLEWDDGGAKDGPLILLLCEQDQMMFRVATEFYVP